MRFARRLPDLQNRCAAYQVPSVQVGEFMQSFRWKLRVLPHQGACALPRHLMENFISPLRSRSIFFFHHDFEDLVKDIHGSGFIEDVVFDSEDISHLQQSIEAHGVIILKLYAS
jgi:hypothetical protein